MKHDAMGTRGATISGNSGYMRVYITFLYIFSFFIFKVLQLSFWFSLLSNFYFFFCFFFMEKTGHHSRTRIAFHRSERKIWVQINILKKSPLTLKN